MSHAQRSRATGDSQRQLTNTRTPPSARLVLLLSLLSGVLVFTGCLIALAAFGVSHRLTQALAGASGGIHSAAAAPTSQAASSTAVLAETPTPLADWHTYTFPEQDFQVDLPAVLAPQHALFFNGGAGESIDWTYQQAPVVSPLREIAAGTLVRIQYSTAITDTNLCPTAGTPITVGPSLPARQETDVPPTANGPAVAYLYVHASLVTGGEAIRIELQGQGPPETFFVRYGAMWQHILASFAPIPPQPGQAPLTTHPCP